MLVHYSKIVEITEKKNIEVVACYCALNIFNNWLKKKDETKITFYLIEIFTWLDFGVHLRIS